MHLSSLAFIIYFVLVAVSTTSSAPITAPPNGGLGGQNAESPSPTTASQPQQQDWRRQRNANRDEEGVNLPDNNGGDLGQRAGHKHEREHDKGRLKHKADLIATIFPWKREPGETELDGGSRWSPDAARGRRAVYRDAVL
jgi:hypothetical protein